MLSLLGLIVSPIYSTESCWQDECKEYSRDVIRRKGTEKLSVEELVAEIIPFAKSEYFLNAFSTYLHLTLHRYLLMNQIRLFEIRSR